MIEHTSASIGSNEGSKVGFLGDFGIRLVRLDEGFDVGETSGLSEAPDGKVLRVARGNRRCVVVGDGRVDFKGFIWIVFVSEFRLGFGD